MLQLVSCMKHRTNGWRMSSLYVCKHTLSAAAPHLVQLSPTYFVVFSLLHMRHLLFPWHAEAASHRVLALVSALTDIIDLREQIVRLLLSGSHLIACVFVHGIWTIWHCLEWVKLDSNTQIVWLLLALLPQIEVSEAALSSSCASLRVDVKVLYVIIPEVEPSVIRPTQHLIACLCKQMMRSIEYSVYIMSQHERLLI